MSAESPDDDNAADDITVTLPAIEKLYREGLLSEEATRRARSVYRSAVHSWTWFDRMLLSAGAALFIIGLGFLVAFNWHALPKFGKLGLVEAGIVACFATAGLKGLDSNLGNAALISGSVLIGIFLAVFGQIYQTGADPWELFAGWAALTVGFALLGRSQILWMIWSLLVDLAIVLFVGQVLAVDGHPLSLTLWVAALLAAVNGGLLALRARWRETRRPDWLAFRWTRWIWAAITLACTAGSAATFGFVLISGDLPDDHAWQVLVPGSIATALWIGASLAMGWYFRDDRHDLGILALVGTSASAVVMTWTFTLMMEIASAIGIDSELLQSFLIGVTGLLITAGLVVWLRSVRQPETGEAPDES